MTTHLSARLAWHDRGWDGCVCDEPHLNASCIVHQHIRDKRDDAKERERSGSPLETLRQEQGWLPPCSRDPAAYADIGFVLTHNDPLEFRRLPSVEETIPAYSHCPSPYRWMREENFRDICEAENLRIRDPDEPKEAGWVFEPDRQRALLTHFWEKIELKKSLIFYYVNQGNPLDEKASRLLVGIGRIANVAPMIYFGTKRNYQDQYPVWSRCVTQDYPTQGVRLPYQEYLRAGQDPQNILCRIPRKALLAFSYVGEHVSDDIAITVIEQMIQSVEVVSSEGIVPGDWESSLAWLNDVLEEVWSGRGAFPGIGSVLRFLDFSKAIGFQKAVLVPMAKRSRNPLDYVLSILDGAEDPPSDEYRQGLLRAREKWNKIPSRHDLLKKLTRFELSLDQVKRIADTDGLWKYGISASEAEIVENPYRIAEEDLGAWNSDPVALETIDHGVLPFGDAALFPDDNEASPSDRRRVRAVANAELKLAAESGDTVLTVPDLLDRVANHFPERRKCECDREIFANDQSYHGARLWLKCDEDPQLVALRPLQALEQDSASTLRRRTKRDIVPPGPAIDWDAALASEFGPATTEREQAAFDEKAAALDVLMRKKLSVLTGGAGTGKTSVVKVFLDRLEAAEGKNPILLLAPTGKARVRLATKTKRNASTIHQFLLSQGWFMPGIFALRQESDKEPFKAVTVVVDECSMIPTDLFGTMLKALDGGPLKRLILVGDPNQLPPIGPGRPFVDTIEWLKGDCPEAVTPLAVCMRTDESGGESGDSVALALADGYRTGDIGPADDEILTAVARGQSQGDLDVVFWKDSDELQQAIRAALSSQIGIGAGDYSAFNRSLGIPEKNWEASESWQILSPTRTHHYGTDDINRDVQMEYRGGLIRNGQKAYSKSAKPFGEQEIVYTDKVIQVVNRSFEAWPRDTGLDYVANGEIGIVASTRKSESGDSLDIFFSTQSGVSYRYYRSQVDENLELAYALTVHKAQGSDFDTVLLVLPQDASTYSRELIYTALTRFRRKLVILLEKDVAPLLRLRSPSESETRLRNTQMFTLVLRRDESKRPFLGGMIHRTRKGEAVRSKSEVIVADILESLGVTYEYEIPLYAKNDSQDFRLPDFKVSFEGDVFYWEHLGMLSVPSYRASWERKKAWYERNGYIDQLITSEDGEDGSIDASEIERIARERILME